MTIRVVVVVDGGLVRDIYTDGVLDAKILVADYDAGDVVGPDGDERALRLDDGVAWVAGNSPTVNSDYVAKVFRASNE